MNTPSSVTGGTNPDNPPERWTWFPLVTRARAQRLSAELDTALQHIVEMREERIDLLAELVHVRDERTQLQREITSLRKEFAEFSEVIARTDTVAQDERQWLLDYALDADAKYADLAALAGQELATLNPPRKRQGKSVVATESESQA